MTVSNFSETQLNGDFETYQQAVTNIFDTFNFDFVSLGLTAFVGAPLKWMYSAGATGTRHRRIVLSPGHGIGGICIKAGKPMLFTDIDEEIDPREYSSYPIVFAEDLRSFCALPLKKNNHVVAVLLFAFRSVESKQSKSYRKCVEWLSGTFEDLRVVDNDFMDFEALRLGSGLKPQTSPLLVKNDLSRVIAAQESERKRISRELHDGIAQEVLGVSFCLKRLSINLDQKDTEVLDEANKRLDYILDELHNISVSLRPSTLDHLGFVSALRSQALLYEKTYGCEISIQGTLNRSRFEEALETQAYRICQEAMLNACKYSESETVIVRVEDSDGWLHATISDYGVGFNTSQPAIKGSGCGLLGMKERASGIGASLEIVSDDQGTVVTLVAPMSLTRSSEAL